MVVRGVDASAWTGEIPPQAWKSMFQDGIKFFIPQIHGGKPGGTGLNPHLQQHVLGAMDAGLAILGGYTWPSWKWPESVEYWERELGLPLKLIWLDVEATAGVHPDQIEDLKARDIIPGIYCSRTSWSSIQGADNRFVDCPLWVAHYYGGGWPEGMRVGDVPWMPDSWPHHVVWQWKGTTTLLDDQFDLNVADEEWIASLPRVEVPEEPAEEEGELSSQEYTELKAEMKALRVDVNGSLTAMDKRIGSLDKALDAHINKQPDRPGMKYHTVVSGETASGIASDHGISLARLKQLNPGKPRSGNWNLIHPGEVFRVG